MDQFYRLRHRLPVRRARGSLAYIAVHSPEEILNIVGPPLARGNIRDARAYNLRQQPQLQSLRHDG